jgi:GrpB-like predicted nucleotidyltransferase (UPF0157 family)
MNDLRHLLGTRAERLDHVGSTAVPGLIAKPKLHIDISLASGVSPDALTNELLHLGYHNLGACFREDEVQMTRPAGPRFHQPGRNNQEGIIAHRLCLCAFGCPTPELRRKFRDALRGNESLAMRYAALKQDLSRKAGRDANWELYTSGKTGFIEDVLSGGQDRALITR